MLEQFGERFGFRDMFDRVFTVREYEPEQRFAAAGIDVDSAPATSLHPRDVRIQALGEREDDRLLGRQRPERAARRARARHRSLRLRGDARSRRGRRPAPRPPQRRRGARSRHGGRYAPRAAHPPPCRARRPSRRRAGLRRPRAGAVESCRAEAPPRLTIRGTLLPLFARPERGTRRASCSPGRVRSIAEPRDGRMPASGADRYCMRRFLSLGLLAATALAAAVLTGRRERHRSGERPGVRRRCERLTGIRVRRASGDEGRSRHPRHDHPDRGVDRRGGPCRRLDRGRWPRTGCQRPDALAADRSCLDAGDADDGVRRDHPWRAGAGVRPPAPERPGR